MAELKPYPKYKDSGVEWIGEIPDHWIKVKLSWLFSDIGSGGTPRSNNYKYYSGGKINWINTGDLNDSYLVETKNKITDLALSDFSTLKIYPKNSLVVAMYGATIGKLSITKIEAATNQACCVLTNPLDTNIKFIFYWFLANRENIINLASGGGQPNISQSLIKSLNVFLPGKVVEQDFIVKYLNKKTMQIDSLIADKERLIELLEEKRQAIITETVTKGLDPDVKMKDSGIDWIGEIPEHWERIKLKYLITLNPSKSEVNLDFKNEVTFIPMEKLLADGEVDYSSTRPIDEVYSGYTYFKNDDIIMAKVTPCFENGNIALLKNLKNGIGFGTTELHVLRANKRISNKFLYYLLQTDYFKQEGISTMYGVGGLRRIPAQFILDYIIGLPPMPEQEEILNYIDKKNIEINDLIRKQKEVINKLKEYRESLIFEAVTGKIDLRNYCNK